MKTPDHGDHWAQPPEWVPLCDLPQWLEWHFKDPGSAHELTPEIIRAIRTRELIYRVEGLRYTVGQGLPPGFESASNPHRIVVTDWDLVAPDWPAGTVAGPARRVAPGHRYAITVWWNRAQRWCLSLEYAIRRSRERQSSSAVPAPTQSADAKLPVFNAAKAKGAGDGTLAGIAPEADPSPFISATELLGLMVYGRADGFLPRAGAALYEAWGMIPDLRDRPEDNRLVLLLQRKSADPKLRKQANAKLPKWASEGTEGKVKRVGVEDMIRRSGRSADELRNELLSDIERFLEDEASRDRRWNKASRRVCEAIAVGRLEARGIECQFGTRVPNKPRQSIPARDVDPDVSALIRAELGRPGIDFVDWLTVPRDVPVAKGEKPSDLWAAVSFRRAEAMAWLAAIGLTSAGDAEGAADAAGQQRPLAPTSQEVESAGRTTPVYKSGAQGRPTSMSLIRSELERRRKAGTVSDTQEKEAKELAAWLAQNHPEAPKASAKAICNSLRPRLREAVREQKTRKERPK